MASGEAWSVVAIVGLLSTAVSAGDQDGRRLMVDGKVQADLGRHEEASVAFRAVAEDEGAPPSLRWEALVRLGLARSAAGDTTASVAAFRSVLASYSDDPEAMRFLTHAVAGSSPGKIWIDFKAEFEELLRTARVVAAEELGMGLKQPKKVTLRKGDLELSGVWRPLVSGRGDRRLEVAAYEVDKMLGLDMVPPTVLRTLEGSDGSLQLWVHGCEIATNLPDRVPDPVEWHRQVSRMTTFDLVIGNRDRNQATILVDPSWEIVLIDHSLSFREVGEVRGLPKRYDRGLVERLRQLKRSDVKTRLEGLLTRPQIEGLLKRRDAVVAHVDALVERPGKPAVFF